MQLDAIPGTHPTLRTIPLPRTQKVLTTTCVHTHATNEALGMPEGPEVRRQANRMARVLCGRRAEEVWFAFPRLAEYADMLRGRDIVGVESRGKALLTRFDGGWNVYSHNQLYGRWYVMVRGREPRTSRQLRFAVHTEKHSALLYSASDIEVLADEELAEHVYLRRLGPDVLSDLVTVDEVRQRLRDARFARRSLGALLLDQSFVSGIGNYLRSEILFVSNLDADRRPKDLSDQQTDVLAEAMLEITQRAYRWRGVTNDLEDDRRLRIEGVPRRDRRHFVFARAGKPCRRCGEVVQLRESSGRRYYWCPACQG